MFKKQEDDLSIAFQIYAYRKTCDYIAIVILTAPNSCFYQVNSDRLLLEYNYMESIFLKEVF